MIKQLDKTLQDIETIESQLEPMLLHRDEILRAYVISDISSFLKQYELYKQFDEELTDIFFQYADIIPREESDINDALLSTLDFSEDENTAEELYHQKEFMKLKNALTAETLEGHAGKTVIHVDE
jgi:SMC interacting uncharacterized protein involved in chromosome segregation